jgi:hypothetical protein
MDESVNKLIENKRLDFNSIWNSKINQGDINLPRRFEDTKDNIGMNRLLFEGIIKLAVCINDTFQRLFSKEEYEKKDLYNILIWTNALLYRLAIFKEVKVKQFKLESDIINPLRTLTKYYFLFKTNVDMNDLSKRVVEYYNILNEFIQQID